MLGLLATGFTTQMAQESAESQHPCGLAADWSCAPRGFLQPARPPAGPTLRVETRQVDLEELGAGHLGVVGLAGRQKAVHVRKKLP